MAFVFVQVQRVDQPAARECQPRLARKEGNVLDPAKAGQRAIQQRAHIGGRHRAIGQTPAVGLDLDQGLQPDHAARPVAHDLGIQTPRGDLLRQGVGHGIGTSALAALSRGTKILIVPPPAR